MGVSPFGNLRIEAYLQLPAAYRSLSRPSSAPDAKAFTLRSYSLELSIEFLTLSLFSELLEFHKQIFIGIHITVKRFSFYLLLNHFHLAVKLYLPIFTGKTKFLIIANLLKFCPLKSVRFYSSICFIRFSMIACRFLTAQVAKQLDLSQSKAL